MTLTEKKQQLADRIEAIKAERDIEIERKVAEFRATLKAEPLAGIDEITNIMNAIDVVLAYGLGDCDVADNVAPTDDVVTETIAHTAQAGRPGMAEIFMPRR